MNLFLFRISSKPRIHIFSDSFTCALDVQNVKSLNDVIEIDNCILGVGDSNIILYQILI